jgi:hypothetical protein
VVRIGKASSRKPMMYGPEKSDLFIVATKQMNNRQDDVRSLWSQGRGPRGIVGDHARAGPSAGEACPSASTTYAPRCIVTSLYPRWEPGALVAHAGICAGGAP